MYASCASRCRLPRACSRATARLRPAATSSPAAPRRPWGRARRSSQAATEHEVVDLNDPELQRQVDALLRELDPELLLDDTQELTSGPGARPQQPPPPQQQQQQQQAAAWVEHEGDEETEAGLPEGVTLTRGEYLRKAAVLVELMAAQQQGAGQQPEEAEALLAQKLAAFRVEVDEALVHMLGRRAEAARQHGQDAQEVQQLDELMSLLQLELERQRATPAMRLLDELLELLGDERYAPAMRRRGAAVASRLRSAFTGGASRDVDVFAAAAALAEDKALAAEALAVEFVPQPLFMQEGMQLLQQAKEGLQELQAAVSQAQRELQQARNEQPQLLETAEAREHMRQVAAADEVLQQRKAAVAQLAFVLDVAQDLDAAEARLAAAGDGGEEGGEEGEGMPSPEQLAALLGLGE